MEQDNSNLQKWMQEAFVQAEEAIAQFEVPVGAVFVAHPRKQSRTRKLEDEFDVTQDGTTSALQHAEYVALQQIISEGKYRPEDLVLYVTVEPCVMCAYAMLLGGIRYAVYGASNDRFGGCGSVLPVHQELHELKCISGIMEQEAIQILRRFYEIGNPNTTGGSAYSPHHPVSHTVANQMYGIHSAVM